MLDPSPSEESDQDGTPVAKVLSKLKDTIPTLIDTKSWSVWNLLTSMYPPKPFLAHLLI